MPTVFFTEILPALPPGTLVGVHDIFLPADYPVAWLDLYLSEQYLLACWLLGGDRLQIELPMHHIGQTPYYMGSCRRSGNMPRWPVRTTTAGRSSSEPVPEAPAMARICAMRQSAFQVSRMPGLSAPAIPG